MQTRPIDVHDDAQLRRFHEIGWRAEMEDGRPWNTFQSFEEMAVALREPSPGQRADALGTFDGDRMVGGGIAGCRSRTTSTRRSCSPPSSPGSAAAASAGAARGARRARRGRWAAREVMSGASYRFEEREDAGGPRFAAAHGFVPANLEVVRRAAAPRRGRAARRDRRRGGCARRRLRGAHVRRRPARRAAGVLLLPGQPARGRRPDRGPGVRGGGVHPRGVPARGGPRPQGRPHRAAQPRGPRRPGRRAQRPAGPPARRPGPCSGPRSCTATTGGTGSAPRSRSPTCAGCSASGPTVTEVVTQNAEVNAQMIGINARLGFEPVALVPEFLRRL